MYLFTTMYSAAIDTDVQVFMVGYTPLGMYSGMIYLGLRHLKFNPKLSITPFYIPLFILYPTHPQ